ncbi:rhodanese-like domain-containing protein [Brachymonas denitrificans]|jgi:phage shock protein E|uniref:Rhodanese-related sulfurtransferase n=1 Tax=Brachymonas denitrificans DSM 15123 TaxID=1121117 RepID=A0A1H8KD43_9BURK|nr:rhodanese-like domain-containing protein [Brachymonas denitrificans]SEN90890.1 Rhodanese-related sulfurtransferase [Brachymonas denitrificans DSM 15123]
MNWLEQLRADMARNKMADVPADSVIVDVRSPGEFQMGHVQGALLLPLSDLMGGAALPVEDKDTPIVVYCASGGRSSMAQALLAQMGYSRVTNGGSPQEVAAVFNKPLVAG